ncbi:hypothetical protein T09_6666 [Trichinella sp. T9]|nr:hypothetical protein T09_6666 [Trichinella sp. T9]
MSDLIISLIIETITLSNCHNFASEIQRFLFSAYPSVRPTTSSYVRMCIEKKRWSLKTGLEPLARVYSPLGKNSTAYCRSNSATLSIAECCFIIPVYTRILPTGEVQKRQPILRFSAIDFSVADNN